MERKRRLCGETVSGEEKAETKTRNELLKLGFGAMLSEVGGPG